MEMSSQPAIVRIACRVRPDQCTLVPERREEVTTEGGLNVVRHRRRVKSAVVALRRCGIITSAFIEPIPEQIRVSAELGFDAIELWTGEYANARSPRAAQKAIQRLREGIAVGLQCGLTVHGGHGLTYRNIRAVASLPGFTEFNIGHSIVSRAVFVGLREAVREMKQLLLQFELRETG